MADDCGKHRYRTCSTSNQNDSQIPILNSPKKLNKTGSLKLKSEMKPKMERSEKSSLPSSPIPVRNTLRRHRSLQGLGSPLLSPMADKRFVQDNDTDSEKSFTSSCNSICGHSPFAHNGTTYSARGKKYVYHCSSNAGSEEYLTPTQRANRTVKRLRQMLAEAQSELIEKENEIAHLTKEVVELRLLKMVDGIEEVDEGQLKEVDEDFESEGLDERSVIINNQSHDKNVVICGVGDSSGGNNNITAASPARFMDVLHEESDIANSNLNSSSVDVEPQLRSSQTSANTLLDNRGYSPQRNHNSPSLADSGHFEDINYTFSHSLEREYERLKQTYDDMRERHNEKVEQLLKIIADGNEKYYELKPKYSEAELKIKELERENEELKKRLSQQDELQKTLYIQMCKKDSDKNEEKTSCSLPAQQIEPTNVICDSTNDAKTEDVVEETKLVADLREELDSTNKELTDIKAMNRALLDANKERPIGDAEMTLRFLKSAVYYFFTDPSNAKDHLSAIQSILEYSDVEKKNMDKALS